MSTSRRLLAATAVSAVCAGTALAGFTPTAVAAPRASAAAAPDDTPVFTISTPERVRATKYGRQAYVNLRVKATAGPDGIEMISKRADDYETPIETTWTAGARSGSFPAGTQSDFAGLPEFLEVTYTKQDGSLTRTQTVPGCLNGPTSRRSPDAAAFSPYPRWCPYGLYNLGSVQGIQGGWSTNISGYGTGIRLSKGLYDVHVEVATRYADAFGLDAASRSHDLELKVREYPDRDRWAQARRQAPGGDVAAPGARPPGAQGGVAGAAAPRPDLRSLPASNIDLNNKGTQLRFGATVWNAGDSPLVIDGFRDDREEEHMDAYQYFFDSEGDQVGYQQLDSEFHWHEDNHQHWHYEDFAAYRLLDADQEVVKTSGKISFCLANTDAVDYTVPGAEWRPGNRDLSTSCGRERSLSIREVLSAGSGDTYAQYRKGQSIGLGVAGGPNYVPDGIYYLSVEANPYDNLVESDTTNNNALRQIKIGTRTSGQRFVKAQQVGMIEEFEGGFRYRQPAYQIG